MDARLLTICVGLLVVLGAVPAESATHKTRNFVVDAPSDEIARQCGECAEHYRRELALLWLGKPLPNWHRPCPITVQVGQVGAGGETTFTFEKGEVFGWRMRVQGSVERILDSVIPHEVNHTIFACHFRRPLPRWADEGAATLIEHESERMRQTKLLGQVMNNGRRIPLAELLEMTEYPSEMQQVLTLYAEGYSLADFLVQQRGDTGRATYLKFLQDAHEQGWSDAIRRHYGFESVAALETTWNKWVLAGSPTLTLPEGQQLAATAADGKAETALAANSSSIAARSASNDVVIRSQSPAEPPPLAALPRKLRVQPIGNRLNAPEPNVTAMPTSPAPPDGEASRSDLLRGEVAAGESFHRGAGEYRGGAGEPFPGRRNAGQLSTAPAPAPAPSRRGLFTP